MIKSIKNFLIIFFIFQQLESQISKIYQNGYNPFCDETLHLHHELATVSQVLYVTITMLIALFMKQIWMHLLLFFLAHFCLNLKSIFFKSAV